MHNDTQEFHPSLLSSSESPRLHASTKLLGLNEVALESSLALSANV